MEEFFCDERVPEEESPKRIVQRRGVETGLEGEIVFRPGLICLCKGQGPDSGAHSDATL